jgi:hypothetical protein
MSRRQASGLGKPEYGTGREPGSRTAFCVLRPLLVLFWIFSVPEKQKKKIKKDEELPER